MIYILLKMKLRSCDSIVPVALELYRRWGIRLTFVTFDKQTFDYIVKNTVIYDVINKIGILRCVGNRPSSIRNKIDKFVFNIQLYFHVLFRKAYILHFGQLNSHYSFIQVVRQLFSHPAQLYLQAVSYSLLGKIIPGKRVFLCEGDPVGYDPRMFMIAYKCKKRPPVSVTGKPAPTKGNIVAHSQYWLWLKDPRVAHLPKYILKEVRKQPCWVSYIKNTADHYYENINLKEKVIVYILGHLNHAPLLKNERSAQSCFNDIVNVISEHFNDCTLLLKPRIGYNITMIENEIAKYPTLDAQIYNLHPSTLACKADVVICHYYSSATYDASIFGKPVIEYSEYSDMALKLGNNQSIRPQAVTHFIQKDPQKLKTALRKCLDEPVLSQHKKNQQCEDNESFWEAFRP